jgi:hypothetical protein
MRTDRELEFEVNLKTGEHRGGGYLLVRSSSPRRPARARGSAAAGRSFPPAAEHFAAVFGDHDAAG